MITRCTIRVVASFIVINGVLAIQASAQSPTDIQAAVDAAYAQYRDLEEGKNADYIPALAKVDPKLFGIAVVTADGHVYTAGNVQTEVSIQSISKVFTMAQVIQEQGLKAIEERIGVDATGMRFNSIIAVEFVKAAEEAGADGIVMGNTLLGMSIDVRTRKPKLGNVMGGLSGPAIKPVALRMVHQCYRSVHIPIIGCGGIRCAEDAVEFMLAGATAVQVGTASFIDPGVMQKIIDGLHAYCDEMGIEDISELTGQVKLDRQLTDRWLRFAQQSG